MKSRSLPLVNLTCMENCRLHDRIAIHAHFSAVLARGHNADADCPSQGPLLPRLPAGQSERIGMLVRQNTRKAAAIRDLKTQLAELKDLNALQ